MANCFPLREYRAKLANAMCKSFSLYVAFDSKGEEEKMVTHQTPSNQGVTTSEPCSEKLAHQLARFDVDNRA